MRSNLCHIDKSDTELKPSLYSVKKLLNNRNMHQKYVRVDILVKKTIHKTGLQMVKN